MISRARQSKWFAPAFTVLAASLPSLYLLLNYPPFFNGTDVIGYLDFPGAIPHYPLFYPLYCSAFLRAFGDGICAVYGIILVQHLFFILSVTYAALYFTDLKRRALFLGAMFFAFRASLFVHGVYTESWAVIAVCFITGALLRICSGTGNQRHYLVYAMATVILLLTRFAGVFLIFVLPLFTFLTGIRLKNLFTAATLKYLRRQLLLAFGLVIVAQFMTTMVLLYNRAPDFSVYGRPGTYRIWDALSSAYTYANPSQTFAYYKSATRDTLVKRTFDIIKNYQHNDLWLSAQESLDTLRVDFIARGIVSSPQTSDGCLNAAFRIYVAHPVYYPWKRILHDLSGYFFNKGLYDEMIGDCCFFINADVPDFPRLKGYLRTHVKDDDYIRLRDDILIKLSSPLMNIPVLFLLMLILKLRTPVPASLWNLLLAATISAALCHVISAVITDYKWRYAQPAEMLVYISSCALLASSWPFKKSLPQH